MRVNSGERGAVIIEYALALGILIVGFLIGGTILKAAISARSEASKDLVSDKKGSERPVQGMGPCVQTGSGGALTDDLTSSQDCL